VNQKHKQLSELQLSEEQKERLDRWAETEFAYSTLVLEGVDIKREQVARMVSLAGDANEGAGSDEAIIGALLESLRTVIAIARARGKAAALTVDLLLKLHNAPGAAPGFRRGAGTTQPVKLAPEHLPAILESACQWYTAESFNELHPVEQASIVFLRLIGIEPFEQANERTALVAASLFTLRSELPPIILRPEMKAAYRKALDEGVRMNTKPMVELVAEAIEKSLSEMIDATNAQGKKAERKR
jgi:Fic/DOC family protein